MTVMFPLLPTGIQGARDQFCLFFYLFSELISRCEKVVMSSSLLRLLSPDSSHIFVQDCRRAAQQSHSQSCLRNVSQILFFIVLLNKIQKSGLKFQHFSEQMLTSQIKGADTTPTLHPPPSKLTFRLIAGWPFSSLLLRMWPRDTGTSGKS